MATLRVFADADGKTNLALADVAGEPRSWCRSSRCTATCGRAGDPRGHRPQIPTSRRPCVEAFAVALEAPRGPVERGVFGADMEVELVNDGPFTLVLDADLL